MTDSMVFEDWTECQMPLMATILRPGTRYYVKRDLRVYVSTEYYLSGQWRHVAIWTRTRYPTWEEIKDARYTFFGDEDEVFQILPPKAEYINDYEYAFHLWSKRGLRMMPW